MTESYHRDGRIAFIVNQAKSEFYHKWAEGLEKQGVSVYYISPSQRWSSWLNERGVSPKRLLRLHDLEPLWRDGKPTTEAELESLERAESVGPLTVSTAILMDRTLNRWSQHRARKYAAVMTSAIETFVREHRVNVVLGETTWLAELLGAQAAAAAGARFFAPSTARIPSERLLFFTGPLQRNYLRLKAAGPEELEAAREQLSVLEERKPAPYYMHLATGGSRKVRHLISETKHHLTRREETKADITVSRLRDRIRNQLGRRWRCAQIRRVTGFDTPSIEAPSSFVYLTLHTQPEASIDVLGSPYCNQLENIRALARLLPIGWKLLVKEHLSAMGDRKAEWYTELQRIPGVRLISPHADGFALMRSAALTLSPSGTVSYEAALMGHRSASFAEMYYSPIQIIKSFCPFSHSPQSFRKLLSVRPPDESARLEFLAEVYANSFPGRIGDPISDPTCMKDDNILSLVTATMKVLAAEA